MALFSFLSNSGDFLNHRNPDTMPMGFLNKHFGNGQNTMPMPGFTALGPTGSAELPSTPYQPLPAGSNGVGTSGSNAPTSATPTGAPGASPAPPTPAPGAGGAQGGQGGGIMDAIMKAFSQGGQAGAGGAGAAPGGFDIAQLMAMFGG